MSQEKFRILFSSNIVLRKDNKVLLALRENTGWMDGKYHFVGGHVEGAETAEEALVRETEEEIGITPNINELKLVFTMHRLNDKPESEYLALYFESHEWEGELVNNEPEKCAGLEWFPLDDLPGNIVPHTKFILENYPNGVNFVSTRGLEA